MNYKILLLDFVAVKNRRNAESITPGFIKVIQLMNKCESDHINSFKAKTPLQLAVFPMPFYKFRD